MNFKIGDKIRGTKLSNKHYAVTTSEAIMEIIDIDGEELEVEILSHRNKDCEDQIGREFTIDAIFMELVPIKTTSYKTSHISVDYSAKRQRRL